MLPAARAPRVAAWARCTFVTTLPDADMRETPHVLETGSRSRRACPLESAARPRPEARAPSKARVSGGAGRGTRLSRSVTSGWAPGAGSIPLHSETIALHSALTYFRKYKHEKMPQFSALTPGVLTKKNDRGPASCSLWKRGSSPPPPHAHAYTHARAHMHIPHARVRTDTHSHTQLLTLGPTLSPGRGNYGSCRTVIGQPVSHGGPQPMGGHSAEVPPPRSPPQRGAHGPREWITRGRTRRDPPPGSPAARARLRARLRAGIRWCLRERQCSGPPRRPWAELAACPARAAPPRPCWPLLRPSPPPAGLAGAASRVAT